MISLQFCMKNCCLHLDAFSVLAELMTGLKSACVCVWCLKVKEHVNEKIHHEVGDEGHFLLFALASVVRHDCMLGAWMWMIG